MKQPDHVATVPRLPRTLTLNGSRIVLKTPTPQDDAAMCEIFSHPVTVEHSPHLLRSGGWTVEEMAARRERLTTDRFQNKGLNLFIHLLPEKNGNGNSSSTEETDKDMVLIGTTGFRSIDFQSGTAEIGIILHYPYWRKGLATEAMYLCLHYAFETLGLERVDWMTSVANRHMRHWCEDLLKLEPFPVVLEDLQDSVGYSILQSVWQGTGRDILERKVSARIYRKWAEDIPMFSGRSRYS